MVWGVAMHCLSAAAGGGCSRASGIMPRPDRGRTASGLLWPASPAAKQASHRPHLHQTAHGEITCAITPCAKGINDVVLDLVQVASPQELKVHIGARKFMLWYHKIWMGNAGIVEALNATLQRIATATNAAVEAAPARIAYQSS